MASKKTKSNKKNYSEGFTKLSNGDQAKIITGGLIILAAIIPGWIGMGMGLLIGFVMIMCGMMSIEFAEVLSKMPWNQNKIDRKTKKKE